MKFTSKISYLLLCGLAVSIPAITGCGTDAVAVQDSGQTDSGSRFLLDEEPTGAIGIMEAKAALASDDHVTIVGRIDAGTHEPWHEGKAAFMLSDAMALIEDHDHDHDAPGHDPTTCPFCSQSISGNDLLAIVQFTDQEGQTIQTDARELLGVKQGQLVVVRGQATVNELGNVVVSADGIYIRQ